VDHYTEVDVQLNPEMSTFDKSTNPVPSEHMSNTTQEGRRLDMRAAHGEAEGHARRDAEHVQGVATSFSVVGPFPAFGHQNLRIVFPSRVL
jgi:hypothetical protein